LRKVAVADFERRTRLLFAKKKKKNQNKNKNKIK
jgi:hypothetical protein